MPINDARAGWIVALLAIALGALSCLVEVSARAAQIEQRVTTLEADRPIIREDLKRVSADMQQLIEGLSRIEQKVDDMGPLPRKK